METTQYSFKNFIPEVTSILRLDPGEPVPDYPNGLVFSYGSNTVSVAVTLTDKGYSDFLAAPANLRAEIASEVFRRY